MSVIMHRTNSARQTAGFKLTQLQVTVSTFKHVKYAVKWQIKRHCIRRLYLNNSYTVCAYCGTGTNLKVGVQVRSESGRGHRSGA